MRRRGRRRSVRRMYILASWGGWEFGFEIGVETI
jgi:hypothetical protein